MGVKRGYALLATLGVSVVVLMMTVVLAVRTRASSNTQSHYSTSARLDFVAQAAVSHALSMFQADQTWIAGFNKETLTHTDGKYTIRFNTNPDTRANSPGESTNNLGGSGVVNGPRGQGTVAAGTAELVIIVEEAGLHKNFNVIIRGSSASGHEFPLVTDGRIILDGDVNVSGLKSLTDPTPAESKIHSNYTGTEAPIEWRGDPGDTAVFEGTLSTSSSVAPVTGTAQLNGSPAVETNAPHQSSPHVNVQAQIESKRGAAAANLSPIGSQTLGDGSGQEFYVNGDLEINGDLNLNDVELYVEGRLIVNGSIEGDGGIYVLGDPAQPEIPGTEFYGSSNISAGDSNIALHSKGSVVLRGFEGMKYFEQLGANDPAAQAALTEIKLALDANDQLLQTADVLTIQDRNTGPGQERLRILMSLGDFNNGPSPPVGSMYNAPNALAARVAAAGNGPTERFLQKRLNDLTGFFNGGGSHYGGDGNVLQAFDPNDPSTYKGMYDSVIDQYNNPSFQGYDWPELWGRVKSYSEGVSWDKLGAAHFKGEIYTNGYFYSENDISVWGAVSAHDDGSQQGANIGGQDLNPGDVFLKAGTNLVYIEESEDGNSTVGGDNLEAAVWY